MALVAACTPTGGAPTRQDTRQAPPLAEVADDPVPTPTPAAEVLWSETLVGRGSVYGRIHGVQLEADRVWVSLSNTNQVPRKPDLFWELVEVDIAAGEAVDRWRETVGGANADRRHEFGNVWPLADSEADIARLVDIAVRTRTHSGIVGAPVLARPDGTLGIHHRWGDDKAMGDWLIMRDPDGQNPVRLDRGFVAAYGPTFSPDGNSVAFTGCKRQRGGCVYGTYIHALGGKTVAIEGLGHTQYIEWSADGSAIYGIDTTGRQSFAARYVLGTKAAERIVDAGLRSMRLAQSPSGEHLVISGYTGEPGTQTEIVTWFSTPDLETTARYERHFGTGLEAVRDDGVALINDQTGLLAVDPFRNRQGKVAGLYQSARASAWDPRGRMIMGHTRVDTSEGRSVIFELVRIDPDAMLADSRSAD